MQECHFSGKKVNKNHKQIIVAAILSIATQKALSQFDNNFNLVDLNGENGFIINGIAPSDSSGASVSGAGDINGDGIDDLIIGAPGADPAGNTLAGSSYVVFGTVSGFTSPFNLSSLNGTNGFVINGVSPDDRSGISVSNAGDVNGDGIDDLIIGAFAADPNTTTDAGRSYVLFGSDSGFAPSIDLSGLNGNNGFVINGEETGDASGFSVSNAGDINGDNIGDLIIGALGADALGFFQAGKSYVVFGSNSGFSSELELSSLNGMNGFVINGATTLDRSGFSVNNAGDINGDGFDDLIIGAPESDNGSGTEIGSSYVVYGSNNFAASLNLVALNGANGFRIDGISSEDFFGHSVNSAGDVNGDGVDDIIIGSYGVDINSDTNVGNSYVIFGSVGGFPANFDISTLNGVNGFVINGINANDESGFSVSNAGDFNGDGIDDLIIGAYRSDVALIINDAGKSHVIFGTRNGFPASMSFSELDGDNGFTINGVAANDESGQSVSSAGDINGDGVDDIIIGADNADPNGNSMAGSSYVVFGNNDLIFKNGFEPIIEN